MILINKLFASLIEKPRALRMSFPKILRIIRVHIVIGGFLAFSLGALLAIAAGGTFNPALFALYYAIVFFGDLSTHFSNDYFDVEVDKHAGHRKFFSGSNILVNHAELRPLSRSVSILLLAFSISLAAVAVLFVGAPIELLIIAVGANFLGWAYSAPPLRLTSRGFGELAIAVATGFAIPAVGYLSVRGQLDPFFVFLTFPFMMYGLVLSLSLEAPDREIDLKGGKRNIAVQKGECTVFSLILAMVLCATSAFVFYAWQTTVTAIDVWVVTLFSVAPLMAGLLGFVKAFQKRDVNRYSTWNIVSLYFFNMFTIAYLLLIVTYHLA